MVHADECEDCRRSDPADADGGSPGYGSVHLTKPVTADIHGGGRRAGCRSVAERIVVGCVAIVVHIGALNT